MTMQCLCQICNCGKHYCPREPALVAGEAHPADPISEYKEKFTAHVNAEVRQTTRHHNEYHPPEGKMANMTTSRLDYVPHAVIPREPKVKCVYVPPEGLMRMTTTYTEDFHRHTVTPCNRVTKVSNYQPSTGKMDTLSTYKDEFRTWPLQRRQPCHVTDNLTLNVGKFCATTTFKEDFRPVFGIAARQPCKPPSSSIEQHEHVPFNGVTNYRLQYVPHPAEALKRPSSAPLQGSSSQRLHYHIQATDGAPVFQGTTEFREKYQPWPQGTRQPKRQAAEYVAPTGQTNFHSTTHTDYVRHECHPVPPRVVRPVIQARVDEREVKQVEQPWGRPANRQIPAKTKTTTTTTTTNTTTYRAQFTPKTAPRPVVRFTAPQQPGTKLSSDVHPAEVPASACLASYAHPPGFQDTLMTQGGHRLYRTISPGQGEGAVKEVATVTSNQSLPSHSVGRKNVVVDGRGRGQH